VYDCFSLLTPKIQPIAGWHNYLQGQSNSEGSTNFKNPTISNSAAILLLGSFLG